ncbi:MAG: hypothetical protein HOD87_10180, partial [Gammaproteobacteria bacterium]|nr:hypothetical protein [Gammaproteobacteria bacterium]
SPFTMNLICQTFQADSIEVLLGRMRRSITPGGIEKRLLDSADELNEELHSVYGLTVDVSALWPSIVAQHKVLFPDMAS